MKIKTIILEEINNLINHTKFTEVPEDIFELFKTRRYYDNDNRESMKIFKAKDGNDYLIKKNNKWRFN